MGDTQNMFIAFGAYSKGEQPGTLIAEWARSDWIEGSGGKPIILGGLAVGGPADGYCGTYTIRYSDKSGELGAPYELNVKAVGEIFELRAFSGFD